ncbi:hypothetical protein [Kaistia terrae]|uniref:Uncharacterized protein n=1 Tax=Kaistia terrae TaxID=537017 RepID=A0ABW0Q034_9HYPH|nr:hypothetical protein [Kaistia terrae]MCX5578986.1 hypothetical protein [Kaistia terrae]
MAIIPSAQFELSPRIELIGTIGEMIDHAVTSKDAMCPYDLAAKIVDEVLSMKDSMTDAHIQASHAVAATGDGKPAATNRSSVRDNVVWLERGDRPAR